MAIAVYGNEQYAANHTLQNVVVTGTARSAYMWTAPANLTVANVMLAHRERTGFNGIGTYSISIRTGTAGGPTGGNLAGGVTFAIPSGGNNALSRWQTIDLTDLAVSGGNTYCIVISPVTSTSPSTALFQVTMPSSIDVVTGLTLFNSADSGVTWTSGNFLTPPFIVNFTDGSTVGQVYSSVVTGGVNNNNNVGEYFVISGYADITAGGVEIYVRKHPSTTPTGNLLVHLERTGVDIPGTTATLTPASATTGGWWAILPFTQNIVFTANEGFRLVCQSPGTDGAEGWQINRLLDNSSGTVKDALTWGTQVSYACTSANSGAAWTRVSGADISFKLLSATSFAGMEYSSVFTDTDNFTAFCYKDMDKKETDTNSVADSMERQGSIYRIPTETPATAESVGKHLNRVLRG